MIRVCMHVFFCESIIQSGCSYEPIFHFGIVPGYECEQTYQSRHNYMSVWAYIMKMRTIYVVSGGSFN